MTEAAARHGAPGPDRGARRRLRRTGAEHERTVEEAGEAIERFLEGLTAQGLSLQIPSTALLGAIARLVAERGYAAVTVADIVAAARTSRRAFYSQFKGKEDAFLAAQTVALQESIGAAAGEFFAGEGWPERVWRAGEAMLSYAARNPRLAYLWIAEANAAGPRAIRRQHDARTAYTVFLEQGYALADRASPCPPRLRPDRLGCLCPDAPPGHPRSLLPRCSRSCPRPRT